MKKDDKKRVREFIDRLFHDRPEERARMLASLDDERFSCHDWMLESGYTQEQRLEVMRITGDVMQTALDVMSAHPVNEWTADDWQRYEIFQWDCTAWFRSSLPGENFTPEQADAIAEAWEHERYVCRNISDGYGRIHHCRFCRDAVV